MLGMQAIPRRAASAIVSKLGNHGFQEGIHNVLFDVQPYFGAKRGATTCLSHLSVRSRPILQVPRVLCQGHAETAPENRAHWYRLGST
jgi:hypothetical protein